MPSLKGGLITKGGLYAKLVVWGMLGQHQSTNETRQFQLHSGASTYFSGIIPTLVLIKGGLYANKMSGQRPSPRGGAYMPVNTVLVIGLNLAQKAVNDLERTDLSSATEAKTTPLRRTVAAAARPHLRSDL